VNLYNTRIQRFPDLFLANPYRFKPAEFFVADEQTTAAPQVALS
jgi:hypothetical protein